VKPWDVLHPDVTAPSPCSERPGARRHDIEVFLKQCSLLQLESLLRCVQGRLGSPDERIGDVDCAQMIAHQINNVLTVERVNTLLRQLDAPLQSPDPGHGPAA
jgi:hypothetical protein